jgi:tRNA-specific 2-thiouridylase
VLEKDQSYFLWGINKDILNHVILPLQDYDNKEMVRKIVKKAGLNVSDKKDSQEVCFVPNDDYKAFLDSNLDILPKSGDICLKDGTVLGKHNGLINYTIGQRKGLNISYKDPLYVIELDSINNNVIVGSNDDLFHDKLVAGNINLLVDEIPTEVYAKVRSRGNLKRVNVEIINDKLVVKFDEAERAITKGQSVVLYDSSNTCLGGGIIEEIL